MKPKFTHLFARCRKENRLALCPRRGCSGPAGSGCGRRWHRGGDGYRYIGYRFCLLLKPLRLEKGSENCVLPRCEPHAVSRSQKDQDPRRQAHGQKCGHLQALRSAVAAR